MRGIAIVTVLFPILTAAHAGAPSAAQIQRLVDASGGTARTSLHRATGVVRFLTVEPGSLQLGGSTTEQRAADFLERYGTLLGVSDPSSELVARQTRVDGYGGIHVSYEQMHRGVPVFAGLVRVHFDAAGRLTAVNGTFVPQIAVDARPTWGADAAAGRALDDVLGRLAAPPFPALGPPVTRLVVFRTGLLQQIEGRDHLVYEVEVGNAHDVREFIYVDAHTGKVVERISGIYDAVERTIHEGQYNEVILWSEGDSLPYDTGDPTNDDQVNGLIDFAEDVYDLFLILSGGTFASWDGAGATMHSVWETTSLPCPNASWNGTSTNYCEGVASDDIVAHEWGHAYTQSTHGLIYQWQSGALNESYSDIFGEVVDLINGAGTDTPGASRTVGDCTIFGGSAPPSLEVNSPGSIAGSYTVGGANFNPDPPVSATAQIELVDDGSGDSDTDACESLNGFTSGRIALIDRGNCNFSGKVLRAQSAGAVGAIIVNSADSVFSMGGNNNSITIPAVMVSSSDGQLIRDQLAAPVSATIALAGSTANSVRWLTGEDSIGFGGAIRDAWNPNCFGDPGKVSDGLYHCSTSDGGGVHTNSGVPNHGFALLVDGGDFNGQQVAALGLTRATHLYWRAMSVYQVPDSGFADHADALNQSCADLLGVELADLVSGAPSGQSFDAADCDELSQALLAVELADEPDCNFQPLLDPLAPPFSCPAVAFYDDFESDPTASWTLTNSGVFPEYVPRDWAWTAQVPEGGTGPAFFAIDSLGIGNCIEGDDDQSGVMSLESPPIALGGEAALAFDHWVATEFFYDGGNLRISTNGGPYQLVSGSDFLFNTYNETLQTVEGGNTNPLAGEQAFTGSDGGSVFGSWGQSQVDLAPYADAGDTIRLRFDLGVDGCNGLLGWYVDNVLVCTSENGAGRISDGSQLVVAKADAEISLSWGASCVAGDTDYEIYEGAQGDFTSHTPKLCTTLQATSATFSPAAGSSYYLVVPRNADREGSYGADSDGLERAQGTASCLDQALAQACD